MIQDYDYILKKDNSADYNFSLYILFRKDIYIYIYIKALLQFK